MNPKDPQSTAKHPSTPGQGRRPLSEWLAVKLDVPADVTEGGQRLVLRGRSTLTVHGCRRILDFTPEKVCLAMPEATLVIRGCRLICTAYLAGAVGIEGWICGLDFCDGEVKP